MSTCCDKSDQTLLPAGNLTVALAGNPNSGKTTIFNALTGLRQKVANYPGVTVEKKTGRFELADGRWISIIDLPGTYSLISRSPDEHVAMEVLRGLRADTPPPDVVVVVVDASNLQRNLYLVSQLIELGRPLVVALNMTDIAARRGIAVSAQALEQQLGAPVIPIVGHKHRGIEDLKNAITRARVAPLPDFPVPEVMKRELVSVGSALADIDAKRLAHVPHPPLDKLDKPAVPKAWICRDDSIRHVDRYQALAERLLIGDRAADVKPIAEDEIVRPVLEGAEARLRAEGIDAMHADVEAHYRWIEGVAQRVGGTGGGVSAAADVPVLDYQKKPTLTERVDRILIHKVWGLLIFAGIMGVLFLSIFWLASPLMDGINEGISALGAWTTGRMSDGPIKALLQDGIFAGVGAVVVFVPQIALLFFFLAVLEDTGYLARAAFLMDRLLSKVGLHGKSFIPLLSSFACAIPGIMATRTIESRRDRLATIFVAPFMSCSARLPVYSLLIAAFFAHWAAWKQAGLMLSLYIMGIVAAAATAWIFKKTFMRGPATSFILELPTYKVPQASQVARQVWQNTSKFLTKAGTTIFCLSVVLWAMTYYPRLPPERVQVLEAECQARVTSNRERNEDAHERFVAMHPRLNEEQLEALWQTDIANDTEDHELVRAEYEQRIASAKLKYSIAGRLGHFMEPAIKPLGYDWKMGVGLVGAFAAREVFVSTMAITYAAGDDEHTEELASAMQADRYPDGRPVWTPLVAVSLLIWFVLAMQCMSTLAIVRRETGGWKWPIFMLVYMNGLAYVVCLGVYQVGKVVLGA